MAFYYFNFSRVKRSQQQILDRFRTDSERMSERIPSARRVPAAAARPIPRARRRSRAGRLACTLDASAVPSIREPRIPRHRESPSLHFREIPYGPRNTTPEHAESAGVKTLRTPDSQFAS